MEPIGFLALTAAIFVGTHLLLAHPLRAPLVATLGERRFQAVFALVAVLTLGLMIAAAVAMPPQPPLWVASDGLWALATLLMWLGSILFVGSFQSNPAFPTGRDRPVRAIGPAVGVFALTRHPMNWAFAIWGLVHIAAEATPRGMIVGGAILFLAIVGSLGQDMKKQRVVGAAWNDWMARTSFIPFGRGFAWPGGTPVIGGTVLFLLATWLHQVVAPVPAGVWRWIN